MGCKICGISQSVTNRGCRASTAHLGRDKLNDAGITGLDAFGGLFHRLTSSAIDLLKELGELASDVGGVTIQNGCIASSDLTGVVENDDLGVEGRSLLGWIILRVGGDVATTDIFDRDVPGGINA